MKGKYQEAYLDPSMTMECGKLDIAKKYTKYMKI
jgi:hypothetical protein